jgi:hypothetical protein
MQGQDLVNFPVVQQAIRAAVADRQRLIRRLHQEERRPLDYRDMVAVLAPALQKGFTRENCFASFAESGLSPFTRRPLFSSHIMATKGKTVKKNTLNYENIKYGKAVTKSVQALLGKGVRLTVGKICDKPLTHEDNIKLFEGIDAERKLKSEAKAAKVRLKKKEALPDDEDLIKRAEDLEMEEMKIELQMATERVQKGEGTKKDAAFLKSRKLKKYEADLAGGSTAKTAAATGRGGRGGGRGRGRGRGRGAGAEKKTTVKKRKRKKEVESESSSDSSDLDSCSELNELIGKTFVDEGETCIVTRITYNSDDEAVAWYMFDGEEEYSSIEEVSEWIAKTSEVDIIDELNNI